jgi:hypothetical protein
MVTTQRILSHTLLMGLMALSSACVVHERVEHRDTAREAEAYREGYYDRDHHRYYHDHAWHECTEHGDYCR